MKYIANLGLYVSRPPAYTVCMATGDVITSELEPQQEPGWDVLDEVPPRGNRFLTLG